MPHYSGITTDLQRRKAEHEKTKWGLRNWQVANLGQPFPSRAAAQERENHQPGEHDPGGAPAFGLWWYGYSFDYDR